MIPLKTQQALKQRFARDLSSRLRIDYFTQKPSAIYVAGRRDCVNCESVRTLIRELAGLSPRLSLTQHDVDDDAEAAQQLGVDKVPGIVLRGQANRSLRYFGSPAGHQFSAFVETLVLVAGGAHDLQPDTLKTLRKLRSDVTLKLFVTPSCTYSPIMTFLVARMAMASNHVKADVIEVSEFPDLVQRYFVRATPLSVLQDRFGLPAVLEEGALAEDLLLAAQGKQPASGGDAKQLTPLRPAQPTRRQGPRPSGSGLILPR